MVGTPTAIDAPAAVVLHLAHRALSNETLPPDLRHLLRPLGSAYADLLAKGRWHSPAREAIDAFVASAQRFVTGTVKLRLSDGDCTVVECEGGSGSSSGIVDPHGRPAGTSDGPPKPTAVEG
jgi:argininosuccinate synthase